jgi:hypothetical protein
MLNTISVTQKVCDLMSYGVTLPDVRIVTIHQNAVADKAAVSDIPNYLARVVPLTALHKSQPQLQPCRSGRQTVPREAAPSVVREVRRGNKTLR